MSKIRKNANGTFKHTPAPDCYVTDDYQHIELLPFNREINKKSVGELIESMKKNTFVGTVNLVETSAIDGRFRLFVLDGQHRVTAAKSLGIPIKYTVQKVETEEELVQLIADLNSTAHTWGTEQYVKTWACFNKPVYKKLLRLMDEYSLKVTVLLFAYTNQGCTKSYRYGKLQFDNESKGDKIVDLVIKMSQYIPNEAKVMRSIVRFIHSVDFDFRKTTKFLNALKDAQTYGVKFDELKETPLRDLVAKIYKDKVI